MTRPLPRPPRIVAVDTNVFVAAGFNPGSSAARLLARIREGSVQLAWDLPTQAETRRILERIPRLHWADAEPLFATGLQVEAVAHPAFGRIPDPADRKFAALAFAAAAVLVSNDQDLLSVRDALPVAVRTPSEYLAQDAADAGAEC